jgi:uncharacterized membrane protein (TIGR02234 family)
VLLAGAVGAGLVLLAVRQRWAQAVFTPPKPLAPQVVDVAGSDLVPLAGALALAALAGLAAVIATRGVARRAAGVLMALFGAGAGIAVLTTVSAATVVNVAAGKIASPQVAADSGAAGSTTSGSSGGSGPLVVAGSAGHAIMSGAPWRVAVLAGALLIFAVGIATVLRGQDWPVMSARYDAPESAGEHGRGGKRAARSAERLLDAASMWESLSGGVDPTDPTDPTDPDGPGPAETESAGAEPAGPAPVAAPVAAPAAEPAGADTGPSRSAAAWQREGKA